MTLNTQHGELMDSLISTCRIAPVYFSVHQIYEKKNIYSGKEENYKIRGSYLWQRCRYLYYIFFVE
jgi:hypothetical protein